MTRMRNTLLLIAGLLIAATVVHAEPRWEDFDLSAPHGQVIIEWTMADESDCTSFVIERSTDGVEYFDIARFTPQGAGQEYRYVDSDVFKQSTRTFHYRIRAEMGQTQSEWSVSKMIAISINTVQQTWGSLKALFR